MSENISTNQVRLASLDALLEDIIPNFLYPVPNRETVRAWFDRARIPRFKSNPVARRGGGTVFYQVSAVEKFLRQRTMAKPNVRHLLTEAAQ